MKGTPQDLFTGASVAESAQERRATLARNQKERVLAALRDAHPHAISHAEICARIGSNRASHRIRELVREGWLLCCASYVTLKWAKRSVSTDPNDT